MYVCSFLSPHQECVFFSGFWSVSAEGATSTRHLLFRALVRLSGRWPVTSFSVPASCHLRCFRVFLFSRNVRHWPQVYVERSAVSWSFFLRALSGIGLPQSVQVVFRQPAHCQVLNSSKVLGSCFGCNGWIGLVHFFLVREHCGSEPLQAGQVQQCFSVHGGLQHLLHKCLCSLLALFFHILGGNPSCPKLS